jgi:DNA ligase (NAD+)
MTRTRSRPGSTRVAARMERLARALRRHDYRYYVLDRPEISGEAYDRLFRELQRLEARTSIWSARTRPPSGSVALCARASPLFLTRRRS